VVVSILTIGLMLGFGIIMIELYNQLLKQVQTMGF
jgi:hypothetical protein